MIRSQPTGTVNKKLEPSYWLSKTVQCVPGGHAISINEAYWCGECGWYICYTHLKKATFTTAIHCPKGHDVSKAT
jgi:hypothetical protein